MRSGIRTTEFWLAACATIIAGITASGLVETGSAFDKVITLIAGVLASLGYTAGRAWVKAADTKAKAVLEAAKANPTKP